MTEFVPSQETDSLPSDDEDSSACDFLEAYNIAERCGTVPQSLVKKHKSHRNSNLRHELSRDLTHEQQQVLNATGTLVSSFGSRMLLTAVPGAGKSFLLSTFCQDLPMEIQKKTLYLAFNESFVQAAKASLPERVQASTIHAFALSRLLEVEPSLFPEDVGDSYFASNSEFLSKVLSDRTLPSQIGVHDLLNVVLDGLTLSDIQHRANVRSVMRSLTQSLFLFQSSVETDISISHIQELSICNKQVNKALLIPLVSSLFDRALNKLDSTVPCLHDTYLKKFQLFLRSSDQYSIHDKVSIILVDEAQDISPVVIDIVQLLHTSILYAGDPQQAIYTFKGPLVSFDALSCSQTFHLSQSFRFGTNIARVCRAVLATMALVAKRDRASFHPPSLRGTSGVSDETRAGSVLSMPTDIRQRWKVNEVPTSPATLSIKMPANPFVVISRSNRSMLEHAIAYACHGYRIILQPTSEELWHLLLEAFDFCCTLKFKTHPSPGSLASSSLVNATNLDDLGARLQRDNSNAPICTCLNALFKTVLTPTFLAHRLLVRQILRSAISQSSTPVLFTTVHASKGMEFREVHLSNDFFPLMYESKGRVRALNDYLRMTELKVLFTAVSRAKKLLQIPPSLYMDLFTLYRKYRQDSQTSRKRSRRSTFDASIFA